MSLRSELSGTFSLAALDRLAFPVAWSGTKDPDEGAAEESELAHLIGEAKEQLQTCYDNGDGESEWEVKIENGEIVDFIEVP